MWRRTNLKFPSIIILIIHREVWAGWEMNGRDVAASPLLNYAHPMKWLKGWLPRRHREGPFMLASPSRLMTSEVVLDLLWAQENLDMCLLGFHVLWGNNPEADTPRCVLITHEERASKQKREREQVTEITLPPSILRESTRICVLEIKTVCLSPDPIAARSGVWC